MQDKMPSASTIHNFAKEMMETLKNYQKPDHKKAIVQMLNSFIPFVVIWIAMYWVVDYTIAGFIALGFLNAFFLVRIFIIQHDCGHDSFVKSKTWRHAIGFLCSVFSAMPYKYWAKSHAFHHNHNGQLDVHEIGDINTLTVKEFEALSKFGKLRYRMFRHPFFMFILGPLYYMLVPNRIPLNRMDIFKPVHKSVWINNLAVGASVTTLCLLLNWGKILAVYFTILYLFYVIAIWFFFVQHQHEHGYKQWKEDWQHFVSALRGSTYYKLPKLFNWFTGSIGVHHIHHLYPTIPNYNLMKVIKQNPAFNQYTTVLTFWQSLKLMHHALWDESTQQMISFREYGRRYKLASA